MLYLKPVMAVLQGAVSLVQMCDVEWRESHQLQAMWQIGRAHV